MFEIGYEVLPSGTFPREVLDEIWNVIESVSEGFLTYSLKYQ